MTTRETTLGPKGRTYGDACGTALALDLVGERWALLVVRELILGPKRFTDLRAGLPGVSSNILAERLDRLERGGVLRRRRLPPPAASRVYELTDWGMELEPVVASLGRWGRVRRGGPRTPGSARTPSCCLSGQCSTLAPPKGSKQATS
jgi:DNA-binding HxlR family transcriptional regulator